MGLFKKRNKELNIYAPVDGEVISIEKVPDDVFAQKMMGDGLAIAPTVSSDAEFVAPMEGELVSVFPTGHAYGIKNDSGIEILMHIGVDTVELNGKGFTVLAKQGDKVKPGDPLVKADLKAISKAAPSIDTPLIFTSDCLANNKKSFTVVKTGKVKKGDLIAVVK